MSVSLDLDISGAEIDEVSQKSSRSEQNPIQSQLVLSQFRKRHFPKNKNEFASVKVDTKSFRLVPVRSSNSQ